MELDSTLLEVVDTFAELELDALDQSSQVELTAFEEVDSTFGVVVAFDVVETATGVVLLACQSAQLDAAALELSPPRLSTAALRVEPARPKTMRDAFMLLCVVQNDTCLDRSD